MARVLCWYRYDEPTEATRATRTTGTGYGSASQLVIVPGASRRTIEVKRSSGSVMGCLSASTLGLDANGKAVERAAQLFEADAGRAADDPSPVPVRSPNHAFTRTQAHAHPPFFVH